MQFIGWKFDFLPSEVSFEALAKGVPLGPKAPKMVSTKHQSARDTQW